MAVRLFIPVRPSIFHPILLSKPFYLAVPEHGETGQRGHHHADTEVLIAFAKLGDGGLLIWIVHEVHEPLQDLRIELRRVLDDQTVLGVLLVS